MKIVYVLVATLGMTALGNSDEEYRYPEPPWTKTAHALRTSMSQTSGRALAETAVRSILQKHERICEEYEGVARSQAFVATCTPVGTPQNQMWNCNATGKTICSVAD